MKALITTVLILISCVSLTPAVAQPDGVAELIKQRESEWTDAMIHVDLDKLNQIVADDWSELGGTGKIGTKASFLNDVKSGAHKLETCEFGPRDVKVLGDVAVLSGSVTEQRMAGGQATTIRVAYMDVWVKRGGRWVVVRSHANKI